MAKDKFFQSIIDALERELDPKIFEACACDLIRVDFPGAVPIPGGQDAGMDGAIADLKGEAFPIVCTTGEDVIGNLTGSLESYLKAGMTRRTAVLVTNRSLTPTKRRNLEARARELGFTLLQVYEQEAVAQRLYRNPRWCKELLGLTGELPALSKIPPNPRIGNGGELIGRAADLEWLRGLSGDAVIFGQPGSGKTSVLVRLADFADAYFLSELPSPDLAAAVREYAPGTIIVDDASLREADLKRLLHVRRELNVQFKILASTWPSYVDDLSLAIGSSAKRELQLLDRDEIVKVIHSTQLTGPPELVAEIVNQAEGKPGLAVLLASLCLREGVERVWKVDVLTGSVLKSLEQVLGEKPREILASFALSGPAGISMAAVTNYLDLPIVTIRRAVIELAAAGVVSETEEGLSVRPPALRYALVRDVFFSGPKSLDPLPLAEECPCRGDVARTILMAAHRGAKVSDQLLREMAESADVDDVWSAFAWLGKDNVKFVLERHPDRDDSIVEAGLALCPDLMIPRLLERAIGDKRSLNATPGHPIREIQTWISRTWPTHGAAVANRTALLEALMKWIGNGGNSSVAYTLVPTVFSLGFEASNTDPGRGNTIRLERGALSKANVDALIDVWAAFFEFLRKREQINWPPVLRAAEDVAHIRGWPGYEIPADTQEAAKRLASKMVNDLASLAGASPGIGRRLEDLAKELEIPFAAAEDELFAILFPRRPDLFEDRDSATENVAGLARRFVNQDPALVAKEILRVEQEADIAGLTHPRLAVHFCYFLGEKVRDRLSLARAFIAAGLAPDLVFPIVALAAKAGEAGWDEFVLSQFGGPLQPHLFELALTLETSPPEVLGTALAVAEKYSQTVGHLCMGGRTPKSVVKALLQHQSRQVRVQAALGLWSSVKRGSSSVDEDLREMWEPQILDCDKADYWLNEVLSKNSALAFEWVRRRFQSGDRIDYHVDGLIRALCPRFTLEQRRTLLSELQESFFGPSIGLSLLQQDNVLYRELLADKSKEWLHLDLLEWSRTPAWAERVLLALGARYTDDDVVASVVPKNYFVEGQESKFWDGWVNTFESLGDHADAAIRRIGAKLVEIAKARRDRCLASEKHVAVYGRGSR